MNFCFLDKLLSTQSGFVATILETDGHTYKKAGHRALYEVDGVAPVYGNLGSLCADQDILHAGKEACSAGKPRRIAIDTSGELDATLGYGTHCGGAMQLLVEPVLDRHKEVYRALKAQIAGSQPFTLVHDLNTGDLAITESKHPPDPTKFIETIASLTPLFLFGATPLTRTILAFVHDMDYATHVIDWRAALLDTFRDFDHATLLEADFPFDERSAVLVLSHDFEHDLTALEHALRAQSAYIGMLSSRKRRDAMYAALEQRGIPDSDIQRVRSPVGLDIGSGTDPEIAVSIVAELVKWRNR